MSSSHIRERSWPSVLLTPISVSNSTITVSSTVGLHPKQQISLIAPSGLQGDFEVKQVVSSTQIKVGPPNKGIGILSSAQAFDGGSLQAIQQNRTSISSEAVFPAVYAEEPTVAFRSHLVDYWGNGYTPANVFPVNLFAPTQQPLSFGMFGLPTYISTLLGEIKYDSVDSESVDGIETITFYDSDSLVGTITFNQSSNSWSLNFTPSAESFLLLEDGYYLLQEDGSHILV